MITAKLCSSCKTEKQFYLFGKTSYSKSGYRSQCKDCEANYRKLHKDKIKIQRELNKDKFAAYKKIYKEINKEKIKEKNKIYRDNTIERRLAYNAKWYQEHKDYANEYAKTYKKTNKGIINNINANRRSATITRIPIWVSDVGKQYIKALYMLANLQSKLTGEKWHVDHVLPLKGKTICGLHVPLNLRIIKAIDNLKKGNRLCI